jgi:phosphate transport system permease protein
MSTSTLHLFQTRPSFARRSESTIFWCFRAATYFVLLCGAGVFLNIFFKGGQTVFQTKAPFVNLTFLTESPESLYVFQWEGQKREMGDREFRAFKETHPAAAKVKADSYIYAAGGIFPCIVGTVLLVIGSMVIALTLGVSAAVYLNEYARDGTFIRFVRLAILNLAGVPSIVFGLFGFGLFVIFFGWNTSLLAGWFTLAFMVLPVVITASEESLKAVPKGFREGSLALGATKWQTIRKNVVPYALPGILDPRHRAGRRRDRADHVHRGLRGERQAPLAGSHPLDGLLLPGCDGAAVPHLRGQLEDPPERVHGARTIWHRLCFPAHRRPDCHGFDCAP